jgi:type IV secretion system protein VirD4
LWRRGHNLPDVQGIVVGCKSKSGGTIALVDEGDVHCMMIGVAGCGKTAFFLYPNIEFACASGSIFHATQNPAIADGVCVLRSQDLIRCGQT